MTSREYPKPDVVFRGGGCMGYLYASLPFVTLEVSRDALVLRINFLSIIKKELRFTHADIERVRVQKYIPIFGNTLQIYPRDKTIKTPVEFWYISLHFNDLADTLQKYGWYTV